ncbi:macro domain-containing protein [Aureibaculum sp. 2210JD6-5]|uniref:type II toxin-antitoxin system antitoxin DNA ADP-ribosyl glycohydrolase DarG n=1 Tax=Aureibaculum sp. 2210JD6-5 TaxID=3103957 RepID=UPI002AAEDD59|nr:macro domain-containing protein [Aureibaculum sp. 2210JD6-5]MDY7396214.1 macro domain-containing protein [Aureibaculum sp. 2210JD6-5]
MIHFVLGNLLESPAQAIVNTVNTVGVMGKGIALQFKNTFPNNYKIYKDLCKSGEFNIGDLLVVKDENLIIGEKLIINFPTKTNWRKPSEYSYIQIGLEKLVSVISEYEIESIAIPPLGSGNGGLQWQKVKSMMEETLSSVDCEIYIYEPNSHVKEILKNERVKLTPARSMLLFMLYELVKNGEFVSEFSSEKICYFLQRFGAKEHFNLKYYPNFYGPYSGKIKHVLNYLNGSYIMGYGGKDKKPFEELSLIIDSEKDITNYFEDNKELKDIVYRTKSFLSGFYSDFGLELLSTVDFIAQSEKTSDRDKIKQSLENWSNRKKTMFSNDKFVDISLNRLEEFNLI